MYLIYYSRKMSYWGKNRRSPLLFRLRVAERILFFGIGLSINDRPFSTSAAVTGVFARDLSLRGGRTGLLKSSCPITFWTIAD